MARLHGKTAVVTGGGRGIGAAIARRFREQGATVLINDVVARTPDTLVADVADSAAVARMFEDVGRRLGRLDILVNNAGISGLEGNAELTQGLAGGMEQQAAERAAGGPPRGHPHGHGRVPGRRGRRGRAVHLDGTFYCSREALKLMSAQDGGGCIINMGSIMGTAGGVGAPAYCAAKAGIMGLTRALARELATRNIRVNAIAPGFIDTDMT